LLGSYKLITQPYAMSYSGLVEIIRNQATYDYLAATAR
jgi:hypothetical protein